MKHFSGGATHKSTIRVSVTVSDFSKTTVTSALVNRYSCNGRYARPWSLVRFVCDVRNADSVASFLLRKLMILYVHLASERHSAYRSFFCEKPVSSVQSCACHYLISPYVVDGDFSTVRGGCDIQVPKNRCMRIEQMGSSSHTKRMLRYVLKT